MNSIYLLIFIHLYVLARVYPFPDDEFDESFTDTHLSYNSESGVEAEFTPRYNNGGVIQVFMPNKSDPSNRVPHPICYPETFLQHLESTKLVHVLCKQTGHVTFGSRYKEAYPEARVGVLATSSRCTSLEDRVSQCPWSSVKTQQCREVLAAKCTSCNHKIIASNGSIHNPGFPHTYLYSFTCEWTLEVPKDLGIELGFEQFALPRDEEHQCESYIELTYGSQKSLSIQRLCPTDLVEKVSVPFKSVRIRFSAGAFRKNYGKQQTHYGFNIIFKATTIETPSTQIVKTIAISVAFILFFIFCIVCYACHRGGASNAQRRPLPPLPPNAPTQDEIQSALEFQRRAMTLPQSERRTMKFSIFQSDNSSIDSNIARWRSQTNLPVTSALAPLGPVVSELIPDIPKSRDTTFVDIASFKESRMVSIATTPRSVFSESRREWSKESAKRIEQLRTKLVARFSSSSSHNRSDISVFLSASDRNSYSKLSCEEDIPLKSVENINKSSSVERLDSGNIPSIVIDFIK